MSLGATFELFEKELARLVESFGQRLAELKSPGYAEAQLRDDFLNPFFRALGWDMENRAGLIQKEREVEIESATHIGGRRKRADYLFRADKRDRFVCEAKKPAEELHARYAFQAKRYAWNKNVHVALLTDFEELKIFIVGGKPHLDEPQVGEWKSWHFRQFPLVVRELWDLLARDQVAGGSIDRAIDTLPKKAATGKDKSRLQWLIKPDRTRALDSDFLEFLDQTRRDLASDIYKNNHHDDLLDGNKLTAACQRIIDRILFLRICEDRDIDTGERLQSIVERWRKNTGQDESRRRRKESQTSFALRDESPKDQSLVTSAPTESLWRRVLEHFGALDRRPPSHVPFFNGNLFKEHPCDKLAVGDEWLAGFIGELSDDESPYLFDVIPVEILGSVYERFLGKVVRPHSKGITVEEKPEVRKAGGVYYTPRYIVDYIVEQTAGKLLDEIFVGDDVGSLKSKPDSVGDEVTSLKSKINPVGDEVTSLKSKINPVGDEVTSLKSKINPVGDDVRSLRLKAGDQSLVTSTPTIKEFEKRTAALRLLDPACGSGSFLIRAFERVCEHWQKRLTASLREVVGDEVTSLKSKGESQAVEDEVTSLKSKGESQAVGDEVTSLKSSGESQRLLTSSPANDSGRSRGDETQTEKIPSQRLLTSSPAAREWIKRHRPLCWVDDQTGDVHLTVDLKRKILTQNIYGVDLDAAAVEVTQLSLYLKMLEGENRTTLQRQRELLADEKEIALLPPLQDNIKCGNSLIASDFSMMPEDLVRVRAFDWPVQFAPIMKAGGFDAVIGNPPYIRIQILADSEADVVSYFSQQYKTAGTGNYDIYVVFIERGLSLLQAKGRLGFIIPAKFWQVQYGEPLRAALTGGKHVAGVVNFANNQVFDSAFVNTCILSLTKSASERIRYVEVPKLEKGDELATGLSSAETSELPSSSIGSAPWVLKPVRLLSLLSKVAKAGVSLADCTDRIFQGLKTSADKIYVLEIVERTKSKVIGLSAQLNLEVELEPELCHTLIKGTEMRAYAPLPAERVILFPYTNEDGVVNLIPESKLKREFPKAYRYLKSNESYLRKREDGKMDHTGWYGFGRTQALDVVSLPKIITPDLAPRSGFLLDSTGDYFLLGGAAGGYGIIPKSGWDSRVLVGLLNSKLLSLFITSSGQQIESGYFSFEARFIRSAPMFKFDLKKPADQARHDKLVGLVDKMLALVPKLRAATSDSAKATLQNAVTATDQQIDALVYELYGLTEDEIKLVEGGQ